MSTKGTYRKRGTVKDPRISVNKLAEYMVSKSNRRREILLDAKFPSGGSGMRYSIARRAIQAFIASGWNTAILDTAIKRLEASALEGATNEDDKEKSIELLTNLKATTFSMPDFSAFQIETNGLEVNSMVVNAVEISVRPDLFLRGSFKGKPFLGAIKIHISKTLPLGKGGTNAAMMIHQFTLIHSNLPDAANASYKHCWVFDAFQGTWHAAPQRHLQLMSDVRGTCTEIADRWKVLEQPPKVLAL